MRAVATPTMARRSDDMMADSPDGALYDQIKRAVKLRVAQTLETNGRGVRQASVDRELLASQLRELLAAQSPEARVAFSPAEQERLLHDLSEEIIGVGPLAAFLHDPTVNEIMINGPQEIFLERAGRLERATATFRDTNHLMSVIERLLDGVGVTVTEASPCVDASLPDGTRINVIIPPLVLNGPTVTIRRKQRSWTMEDLRSSGLVSQEVAQFLECCVRAKVNLVISGGTSTGKTTLVTILSTFIPPEERVISIENVAELELINRQHWVRLVGRAGSVDGRGEIPLRTLVRNALRMRPDRIILGEARGGEALDVVQAMHTGHDGVITVLHGNSPLAALERLETMMLMSGLDLPPPVCRAQIASAVDAVIHLARYADGSRRIASIAQVLGTTPDGFQIEEMFTQDVRGYSASGTLDAGLRYTGARPKVLQKFRLHNVEVPAWIKS